MANIDERKFFLSKFAESESDNTNFFDVEKEFFLIDSDNLNAVKTHFYGYAIRREGIYESDNLTDAAINDLGGRGCYVYVRARDGIITIEQDLNGSWGIYLFRHGDYFALSNSFFRLLDHVKFRCPLTINRDYCHYLLINELCSHACSETAVNEIRLVERNAIIRIDAAKKNLHVELIDYRENSVELNSREGLATLDYWFEFWQNVLYGVAQRTDFISGALSGGVDSRLVFPLLLHSGLDLNKIPIESFQDKYITHAED